MDILAKRLLELRETTGKSLIAISTDIDVSNAALCKWENGINEPKASHIVKLAKYYSVSADYLLGLEDDFGNRQAPNAIIERPTYDITDKQLVDLVKLFGVMTEIQKARVVGYVIAYLQSEGVNVGKVLGY